MSVFNDNQGRGVENGGVTSTHAISSIYTQTLAFRMASLEFYTRRNAVKRTTLKDHRLIIESIRESALIFIIKDPVRT